MEEFSIRSSTSFVVPQRQTVSRTSSAPAASAGGTARAGTGFTVSQTLRQLMERVGSALDLTRESRGTLRTGAGVLAEVQEKLARIGELAREASGEGSVDRGALQSEAELLSKEIDRILSRALAGDTPLFLDADGPDGSAFLRALMSGANAGQSAAQALPHWLTNALFSGTVDTDRLLASLGLEKGASGADVLAALAGRSLESDPAAGYVAALYLGAVISKGTEELDPESALEGLRQLMEALASGESVDEAIERLTGGEYTSLADFQEQVTGGTAPGIQAFLDALLMPETMGELFPEDMTLLMLLAGTGGMELDLLMALLSVGQTSAPPESSQAVPDGAPPEAALAPENAESAAAVQPETAQPMEVKQFGDFQVLGRDLSEVTYDTSTGQLTVGGASDVVIQGTPGQVSEGQTAIQITGSGTVTLQDVRSAALTVDADQARIVTAGASFLGEVRLGENTTLTIDGRGFLHAESFQGGEHALLRLTGGALALAEDGEGVPGTLAVPVVLDGPVSLAAQAQSVHNMRGEPLEPFDILWKTLLPGFDSITSMELAGRQARMSLLGGEQPDAARLWLEKGDLSAHGYPAHSLVFRGRDKAGRLRTRYAYLRWTRAGGAFQEVVQYPNPFTVTGGEEDRDWYYEEGTQTLHILSDEVTAVSGGTGTDVWKEPFSGRIALPDRLGALELTLGGVTCRVGTGRAFRLGRENEVTLILRAGTANVFESGAGCAGISMEEGTSLRIDCAPPRDGEDAAGTLTATGGAGSAGIGQDSGAVQDRSGHIMIRGGAVTGSEKPGSAGSVTIVGSASAGSGAGSDLGSAKTWARMGLFLQMGEDAVILPQFPLSSRTLQLNKLRVSTREYARAARMTIDADRRWVSQIQTAYNNLSNRLEQSIRGLDAAREYLVRDNTSADLLLREISRTAPILSDRAMQIRSLQSLEEVNRLLR